MQVVGDRELRARMADGAARAASGRSWFGAMEMMVDCYEEAVTRSGQKAVVRRSRPRAPVLCERLRARLIMRVAGSARWRAAAILASFVWMTSALLRIVCL